ncbi:uncharacterized protein LOC127863132 isoform X2 [Dreissena polymorpha]|uniref:Mab-21-like nucleotidyltransferase domain-containing protein n=2 Tax=Dreissena polymorpha TaxID=45954 RepID=A0A9D3Y4Z4_DREPO|nr:uncharacterized protein LOC127863132 isoform X2 [Dreissena polymorpha]XP_052258471.1 uncharacterized protein LOC127863132 isoform X2 [Dreissena polymorpha]XP_052258472.1 uncharacterized protein LOC127863132 isoform X2 [Dreissena polymorpha]KAH3693187.1 hypothetical protein DPMN_192589 [Dreissena polymorpha]
MAEGGGEVQHAMFKLGDGRTSRSSCPMFEHEDISVETSIILNKLGYGQELIQKRRDSYRKNAEFFTERFSDCTIFAVGSKADGISRCYESDTDLLYVRSQVECVELGYDINTIPEDSFVFRMNTRVCHPGHCLLLLERGIPWMFFPAFCDDGHGHIILSSTLFLDIFKNTSNWFPWKVNHARAGPSLPFTLGPAKVDAVNALRCHCPSILHRWAARSRHWPSPDIVQKVVSMGAFVSPVGFKASENKDFEWRICFNTGETELVTNLNNTQIKIYVILKMIAKDVLQPRNKEITSYSMKNIVLWLAENNPQKLFHQRSLFYWLRESLSKIRAAISTRQLPYYMIPERNLMKASELTDDQQKIWLASISEMIHEGPRILLRLPTIRMAIIAYPMPLLWYNERRTELEIVMLEETSRHLWCKDQNGVDIRVNKTLQYALRMRRTWLLLEIVLMSGVPLNISDLISTLYRIYM